MAQFDVYINPQPGAREFVPYVLDVQSGLIDKLATRLVLPLTRVGANVGRLPVNLCPVVEIAGETLSLQPHLAAPIAARLLKKPVLSLRHRASEVSAALDTVISGF